MFINIWSKFTNIWSEFINIWSKFSGIWSEFTHIWNKFINIRSRFTVNPTFDLARLIWMLFPYVARKNKSPAS